MRPQAASAILAKLRRLMRGTVVSRDEPIIPYHDGRAGNRERAMPGLYFEEFSVGQVFDHPIRRTITEADNVLFSTMTHNPAPLHLDAEYMKNTEFGKPLVNSALTLGFMVGISVNDTTHGTTVANLGWDAVRISAGTRYVFRSRCFMATRYTCRPRCWRSARAGRDPTTAS
jgi:hypothetical protein